jgi:hypothetical protein
LKKGNPSGDQKGTERFDFIDAFVCLKVMENRRRMESFLEE